VQLGARNLRHGWSVVGCDPKVGTLANTRLFRNRAHAAYKARRIPPVDEHVLHILFERGAAPYLAGLLALLCVAAMQFAVLVVRPLTSAG
jgi:hypothetical protein